MKRRMETASRRTTIMHTCSGMRAGTPERYITHHARHRARRADRDQRKHEIELDRCDHVRDPAVSSASSARGSG